MTNPLFDELFGRHARREDAFLHLPDGSTISYADFLRTAARFANVLRDVGVTPGDRVAVQVAKSPSALAIYAACAQAGAVFLPLNTAYTPSEMGYFLRDSAASLFVCDGASESGFQDICTEIGARILTLNADGSGTLAALAASQNNRFETVPREASDLAAFLYTSGTTGRSKGAMLTQENLLSNARVLVDVWRFTSDDVLLHALPIFHSHGLFVASNVTLLAGGSMIFLPKFELDAVVGHLPRATAMMGVPTFYTRLLDAPRFDRELAAHMRLFISGSAPLLAETHERFEARTGHRILERYGMTETNMNTSNPYDGERRAGTVGFPLPGVDLKIADPETGRELARGEIGQIEVRGPNVFIGYWQMPEKTREELKDDGFFLTGDLGLVDDDGYVHIVGRSKDLIIAGGYNIYPKEIEDILDAQQGVLESAVIGVPNPDFGESVVAILVPEKGAELDLDEIRTAVASHLASFKRPQFIEVLPELPRNTMGKVQKNELRERYKHLFAG